MSSMRPWRPGPTGRGPGRERLVHLLNRLSVPLSSAIVADREERRRATAAALLDAGIRPAEVARLVDLAFPPVTGARAMIDTVFEPAVHRYCERILAATDRLEGDRSFEDLDRVLQGLLMAAAHIQLEILEMPETDLALFRLTTAAYGQVTTVSASMLEEQAHWRALAALRGGTPIESEDQ